MSESYLDGVIAGFPEAAEELQALRSELKQAEGKLERTCVWNDDNDYWEGSCGIAWTFPDGGIEENEVNYCPKCGGKVQPSREIEDE